MVVVAPPSTGTGAGGDDGVAAVVDPKQPPVTPKGGGTALARASNAAFASASSQSLKHVPTLARIHTRDASTSVRRALARIIESATAILILMAALLLTLLVFLLAYQNNGRVPFADPSPFQRPSAWSLETAVVLLELLNAAVLAYIAGVAPATRYVLGTEESRSRSVGGAFRGGKHGNALAGNNHDDSSKAASKDSPTRTLSKLVMATLRGSKDSGNSAAVAGVRPPPSPKSRHASKDGNHSKAEGSKTEGPLVVLYQDGAQGETNARELDDALG